MLLPVPIEPVTVIIMAVWDVQNFINLVIGHLHSITHHHSEIEIFIMFSYCMVFYGETKT